MQSLWVFAGRSLRNHREQMILHLPLAVQWPRYSFCLSGWSLKNLYNKSFTASGDHDHVWSAVVMELKEALKLLFTCNALAPSSQQFQRSLCITGLIVNHICWLYRHWPPAQQKVIAGEHCISVRTAGRFVHRCQVCQPGGLVDDRSTVSYNKGWSN